MADGGAPVSSFGVYVHIPFCRMLCTYCDFVKYRGLEGWYDRYVDAVVLEAEHCRDRLSGQGASLFFGGGTPSALGAGRLHRLREQLAAIFAVAPEAEQCLEANPEDVDADLAGTVAAAGFNRVSVGIQTFDDALLRRLGRLHSGMQAERSVRLLLDAGIASVSADLMLGLPGQTRAGWQGTLEQALRLDLPHLSCYALTLEPATPLGRQVARRRATIPDDDVAADMYDDACRLLAEAGYRHYEVSNWARPGHESRHNQGYWRGDDYVGLGAGAVGCVGGRRWWNERAVAAYCAAVDGAGTAVAQEERLTPADRAHELVLLALRTAEGLDLAHFRSETAIDLVSAAGEALAEAQRDGLVCLDDGRLQIPEPRWGVLHSIVAQLLGALPAGEDAASSSSRSARMAPVSPGD